MEKPMGIIQILSSVKRVLICILRELPIVSGLPDVQLSHHRAALRETLTTIVLATIPLWLGGILAALLDVAAQVSGPVTFLALFQEKLSKYIADGALILYGAALVAPVLCVAVEDYSNGSGGPARLFPARVSHILGVLGLSLISAGFFSLQYSSQKMNEGVISTLSIMTFIAAVFLLYVASAYKKLSLDPAREFTNANRQQVAGYAAHRGSRP